LNGQLLEVNKLHITQIEETLYALQQKKQAIKVFILVEYYNFVVVKNPAKS